ncbi:MAG: hypothetical protein A3K19_24135 [Lentisphaerae bacterium RIFOXYB12_FULL_65_16]|nr:MAG: hypothetical protein A3K18_27170 [Lentisphaerae bacterium RIFOXYA12_64_32]OGV87622.1 MAG: hypothetical protein A3K19_24135 [Lentisphaerae bacterium RIFOXYB12_FULL_65_16]
MGQVDHTARLPVSLSRIGLLACLVLILCRGTANGAGSGKTEPASGTGGLPTMLVDSEGETAAEEPPKAPTPPPACAQQALGIVIGIALLLLVVVGLQAKGLRRKLAAANRHLREHEARFSQVIANAHAPMVMIGPKGEVLRVNPCYLETFGYTKEETPGIEQWIERALPDDEARRNAAARWKESISPSLGVGQEVDLQIWKVVCKDGAQRDVNLRYVALGNGGLLTLTDVTEHRRAREERHQLQAQIAVSKRMEELGQMTGAVAHDLNNVLSGVVNFPELLLMTPDLSDELRSGLETIEESGRKAAVMVGDLLVITKGGGAAREVMALNAMTEEVLRSPDWDSVKRQHPDLKQNTELAPDLLNVVVARGQVRSVLLNLFAAGAEAAALRKASAPEITIRTANRYVDQPIKGRETIPIGEYAVLSVTDSGPELSADDLARLFDALYAKKTLGRGTRGLGLKLVWMVVKDHYGYVNATSAPTGTTVDLFFPTTRETAEPEQARLALADCRGNGEKVLVVDDEGTQREVACTMLAKLGYRAQAVSSGEAAVDYVSAQSVDLLLLDMVMPGLNGRETYEKVLTVRPGQRAVLASGFGESEEVRKTQSLGAGGFLKKPYSLLDLGSAIKTELQKAIPANG